MNAGPALHLRELLNDLGLLGVRIGVEHDDVAACTAANGRALDEGAKTFGAIEDASDLVPALRVTKSPAELAYVRCAAELADEALDAGLELICAGADEAEILAAMQGRVLAGGGDYPGNPFIIGSGATRSSAETKDGQRRLDAEDQITPSSPAASASITSRSCARSSSAV